MATVANRVQEWRNRIVRLQDALEDVYNAKVEYDNLGGSAYVADVAESHPDLEAADVASFFSSTAAIKTFIEGNFHDDVLVKARS